MKTREIAAGITGLVLGILIGMLLVSGDVISVPVVGVASPPYYYYIVELSEAVDWLKETSLSLDTANNEQEEVLTAIDNTLGLPPWREVWEVFPDEQSSIDMTLKSIHETVLGVEVESRAAQTTDDAVSACLALDDDPYRAEGPGMYLYIKLDFRQNRVKNLSVEHL